MTFFLVQLDGQIVSSFDARCNLGQKHFWVVHELELNDASSSRVLGHVDVPQNKGGPWTDRPYSVTSISLKADHAVLNCG